MKKIIFPLNDLKNMMAAFIYFPIYEHVKEFEISKRKIYFGRTANGIANCSPNENKKKIEIKCHTDSWLL